MKRAGLPLHSCMMKDEDEVIEVVDIRVQDLNRMVREGKIVDAKTICLIHRCLGC